MGVDVISFWMITILGGLAAYVVLTKRVENKIFFALISLFFFTVSAFSAFGVDVQSNGVISTYSYPAVGIISFVCAVIMLTGVLEEAFDITILGGRF
jgi:hypothetical protein